MDALLSQKLPSTTNAVESLHSYLYQISEKGNTLYYGLKMLAMCMNKFQCDHDLRTSGKNLFENLINRP
jgi:hypothetical protein